MHPFFAPAPDQDTDILRPIHPMLEPVGPFQLGRFASAPVDPMIPSFIGTPVVDIFAGHAHQFATPALNGMHLGGISDVMDVFAVVKFLADGGR